MYDKIAEEMVELSDACSSGDTSSIRDEYGGLLFSVVNLARFIKVDAEEALAAAADKFIDRFDAVEKLAAERGMDMPSTPMNELDKLWDEVKEG